MKISDLENVLVDQRERFLARSQGIRRDIDFEGCRKTSQILVITGLRRAGKSTLLRQFADRVPDFHYLNLDDERLIDFQVKDFSQVELLWLKQSSSRTILLDEVQNVQNWERFVRRMHDDGYKLIVTGSNSRLLSSELGTHLTGRHKRLELYPFSFKEYLEFHALGISPRSTPAKAKVLKVFDQYLVDGGIPYYCQSHETDFLVTLYENILYKDILFRHAVREKKAFRELAAMVFSNVTKEFSYLALKNALEFKSKTSVKNYMSFMEDAYLIFQLSKYDFSLKKQHVSNKKVYCIDNGLRNAVGFHFSDDAGRLLENLVFIELKRRQKEVYFHREKSECDFIVKSGFHITEAIQVTWVLNEKNTAREFDGLYGAISRYNLQSGVIITSHQEETKRFRGKNITVIPAWKWLLQGS